MKLCAMWLFDWVCYICYGKLCNLITHIFTCVCTLSIAQTLYMKNVKINDALRNYLLWDYLIGLVSNTFSFDGANTPHKRCED